MRSDLVVLPEPNIDSDLGLPCGVEPSSLAALAFSVVSVGNVGILETFLLDFLWGLFGFAYTIYTSYILYSLLR